MIEKSVITINGEEYAFLKPYACDLIDIEDQCIKKDGFDEFLFNKLMLKLVSPKLNVNDLITFSGCKVKLSSGEEMEVENVGYEKYKQNYNALEKRSRVVYCKELLKMAGVGKAINLNDFTYDDINDMAEAYISFYDDSELKEVVEKITDFCFSKKGE